MIVELAFPTGRFHATPWGRHVNEGVPEWPPSPFRLVRAMLDAWYRKHPDIPASVVEELMSAISAPPVFRLPRARASHTRSYLSQNKVDPTDKKMVFDGFAVVDRADAVLMGWPGASPSEAARAAASTLLGSLSYLGRSESWIDARVREPGPVEWNCSPLTEGALPSGKDVVSVAGVVPPDRYAERPFQIPSKKGKPTTLPWFEALGWGSAEAIAHRMNRPPALEPLLYLRNTDALDAQPAPRARSSGRTIEAARFTVDSRVRVPITDALHVAEHVRRNLMGALRRVLGHEELTPTFTGKDADGKPVRGHTHATIFVLDEDHDGYVDALLVVSPQAFSTAEQRAVDRLRPVPRRNGHPLVLTPVRYGTRSDLLARSTTVVSHTPFAPPSHWRLKRDGDFFGWLSEQVKTECDRRGLPRPIDVRPISGPLSSQRRSRWLDFRRSRKGDAPQPAFGLKLVFATPVEVPFSLGYASHFGLGCFVGEYGSP